MDLNLKLVKLRKGSNLTQAQLAIKLGVPKHNIGAYEDGRAKPPFDTLKKIIDFYEIPKNEVYSFLFD